MDASQQQALDVLYEGWIRYRREVKGYQSTAPKIDIEDWENWKLYIADRWEEKHNGNGSKPISASQLRLEDCQNSGQPRAKPRIKRNQKPSS